MQKFFIVLVGGLMFFSAPLAFAAIDDATHYFTFDEGTGRSVGDAKGGQNGVMTGTSTGFGWASGVAGTALAMDGLDGESIALPDGFLTGSQGSISLWFKMTTLSSRNIIFSGRSTTDNYIHVTLMVDYEGRPQLMFRTASDGADRKAQGNKVLNRNEWYNLVLTANGLSYRMYINGEEVLVGGDNTGRWIPDMTHHTLRYRIGALSSNVLSGVFDGYLDDLRFYGRPLDMADVAALYNDGNPGTPGYPVLAGATSTATTQEVALETPPATVPPVATPVTVTPPTVTTPAPPTLTLVTPPASTPSDAVAARKALIDELLKQILLLIAELQKQLAILKGQSV